jgi:hypothetical protein
VELQTPQLPLEPSPAPVTVPLQAQQLRLEPSPLLRRNPINHATVVKPTAILLHSSAGSFFRQASGVCL